MPMAEPSSSETGSEKETPGWVRLRLSGKQVSRLALELMSASLLHTSTSGTISALYRQLLAFHRRFDKVGPPIAVEIFCDAGSLTFRASFPPSQSPSTPAGPLPLSVAVMPESPETLNPHPACIES